MTPEQEEQVRRALGSTPPEAGLPDDVAARLDATMAQLVAERAPADELAARRRRRWPQILVAAAGVSVIAYGVGVSLEGLPMSGGSADSATASRDQAYEEDGAPTLDGPEAGPEAAPETADKDGSGEIVEGYLLLTGRIVRLHRSTLTDDVQGLVPQAARDRRGTVLNSERSVTALAPCAVPETDRGDRVAAVRLDGDRATLVLRKAVAGTHVAEVYSCADPGRLLAITEVESTR